jgi:sugar O-acyltransferase (sialic acid O-acetyltransferase NeuD family)
VTTLALVAASGLAREVLAVPGLRNRYERVVVLDDDPRWWGDQLDGCPVVVGGTARAGELDADTRFLICAGSGAVRRTIAVRLLEQGVGVHRFATVVHPSVHLPESCLVGPGSIVLANAVLTSHVRVRRHVVVMPGVVLTHDDEVDDFATLCAGVSLGGHVHVGEAAYVGMNASVRERTSLGSCSTLGMGAVLLRDLPAHETWAGNPARPLSPSFSAVSDPARHADRNQTA